MILLLRDTREQNPLKFDGFDDVAKIEDIALPFGDYTAMTGKGDKWKQVPVCVERKALGDLWKTMASDEYERFKREVARCHAAGHKMILAVEGSYGDVLEGFSYSQFSGESMVKKLATLYVKYDIDVWYAENRKVMARRVVEMFSAIDRCWK
jgi:ERCC4-type nuclease